MAETETMAVNSNLFGKTIHDTNGCEFWFIW
jgi:hypothetical protein